MATKTNRAAKKYAERLACRIIAELREDPEALALVQATIKLLASRRRSIHRRSKK